MTIKTAFVPMLIIPNGVTDISFYTEAFGAIEHQRWSNEDGTLHVAELSIDGALFHLHEVTPNIYGFTPEAHGGVTTTIGLWVEDVHTVFDRAVAAGAKVKMPVTDFDYGYRQGDLIDPFGHVWTIERKI